MPCLALQFIVGIQACMFQAQIAASLAYNSVALICLDDVVMLQQLLNKTSRPGTRLLGLIHWSVRPRNKELQESCKSVGFVEWAMLVTLLAIGVSIAQAIVGVCVPLNDRVWHQTWAKKSQ